MAATKLLSDNGASSGITGYQLTGGNDGTLQLQTTTSGGTATTAVTIDNSQNVGIGTSSPAVRLHAMSSAASLSFALSPSSSNTNIGYVTNDSTYIMFASGYGSTGQKFRVALAAPDNAATIDSSGNVNVGTSGGSGQWIGVNTNASSTGFYAYNDTSQTILSSAAAVPMLFKTSNTERMRIDSSGNLLVGTATQATGALLTVNGSIKGVIASGVAVSASGTAVDFTGIPSWAKRVVVMLSGVSTNGTSPPRLRLSTGGTFATSGYAGANGSYVTGVSSSSLSAGFDINTNFSNASNTFNGSFVLTLLGSNAWTCSGLFGVTFANGIGTVAGAITLGGALDAIRVTTVNGTDSFDAGSINIQYEG